MTASSAATKPDTHSAVPLDGRSQHIYRVMLTIRAFEEECLRLHEQGQIAGSVHPCCGHEAIPTAVALQLEQEDRVIATYRGHGWAVALGVPLDGMFAEVCGRATGTNGGRGGSAYLSSPSHRLLGENSIVGAGLPVAAGVALAAQVRREPSVCVCSFGEGATSQGAAHEALVTATARQLPVVFICENNGWSEMTPFGSISRGNSLARRIEGYGIPSRAVDGTDATTVADAVAEALARARSGGGPSFLEMGCVRLLGHYQADIEHYRDEADREQAHDRDPIARLRSSLLRGGDATRAQLEAIEQEVARAVADASTAALDAPLPEASSATEHVTKPPQARSVTTRGDQEGVELSYVRAVNRALRSALAEHPECLVFGEDVAVPGGVFGATRGLLEQFGADRVFDTPIAESAILGMAVGASLRGMRPVAEVMWGDFLLVALDQLVNQAANARYLSRGELCAGLTVRCQQGAIPGSCAQHSQSLEALLAHIPGLKVGLPATAQDAFAMLRAAIADPDPVVVIEARALYQHKGRVLVDAPVEPVGGAREHRSGSDLAMLTWGTGLGHCLSAATMLSSDGFEASVLDLRWLAPLDDEAIARAVESSGGRVLVVHEANLTGGFGAEIAARIVARHFDELDAPVLRVGAPDVRFPAAPSLQAELLPTPDRIIVAASELLG